MDRLNKIIALFLISFSSLIWAQKDISVNTSESVFIHLNATSFVTGETIYYKLYCLNPNGFTASNISKVAYVELIDDHKKVIFNHKLFLEKASGQGDFFITASIPTGTYKLIGYTKWMLNKTNSKSFESDITIINPFQTENDNKISSKSLKDSNIEKLGAENVVELNKKNYSTREKVDLKINNLSKGNYSLSVRKIEDLPRIKSWNAVEFSKKENYDNIPNSSIAVLPELRGEIVSGTITSKNEAPINNIAVALSIPGKAFEFKLVKTNKDGKFIFNLDKAYYEPNCIIQVLSNYKEDYTITLDNPTTFDTSSITIENDAKLSSELKSIIEEHSVASQIENTYFEKKADTLARTIPEALFYEPTAKEYILDNYTRFPTIKETITEVVKEMHYYNKNNVYSLYLSDYDPNTEIEEPPLVLIDGLLVQDINELLEYKAVNIYKICIINQGYSYGNKIFNGVISFITKKYEYNTNLIGSYIIKTSISTPLAKKNYFKPDYSNAFFERIPDYRHQLLWMPDLMDNTQFSFYTSDKKGIFEIVVEGFTLEGTPITIKDFFEVK